LNVKLVVLHVTSRLENFKYSAILYHYDWCITTNLYDVMFREA